MRTLTVQASDDTSSCTRGHWTAGEDSKLRRFVEKCGAHNWNSIAVNLPGRSGKSCRLRWFNQLDPRINRRRFTEDEEKKLIIAQRIYGNKWSLIARIFPGRTDNAIKNQWHVITARSRKEQKTLALQRRHQHLCYGKKAFGFDTGKLFGLLPGSSSSSSSSFNSTYFRLSNTSGGSFQVINLTEEDKQIGSPEKNSPPFIDFLKVNDIS